MLRVWIVLLISPIALFEVVRSQDSENEFIVPDRRGEADVYADNAVYIEGSYLNVTWRTNMSTGTVALAQEGAKNVPWRQLVYLGEFGMFKWSRSPCSAPNANDGQLTYTHVEWWNWKIDMDRYDLDANGHVFTLVVQSLGGSGWFGSHAFNISRAQGPIALPASSIASSHTPAMLTSTSLSSPSFISSMATPTNYTETPTTPVAPEATAASGFPAASNPGTSTTLKIGIGVGVSVGVLGIVMGVLGLYWMRRSRTREVELEISAPIYDGYTYPPAEKQHLSSFDPDYQSRGHVLSELDANVVRQELHGEDLKEGPKELE